MPVCSELQSCFPSRSLEAGSLERNPWLTQAALRDTDGGGGALPAGGPPPQPRPRPPGASSQHSLAFPSLIQLLGVIKN